MFNPMKSIAYSFTFATLTFAWLACVFLKTSPKVIASMAVITFTALLVLLLIYEDKNNQGR